MHVQLITVALIGQQHRHNGRIGPYMSASPPTACQCIMLASCSEWSSTSLVQASPNFKLILDHSNTLLSGPFDLCISLFVLCWELKSEYAICRGNIRIFNHIIFIFFL